MTNRTFYRRQLGSRIVYIFLLCFLGLFTIVSFVAPLMLFFVDDIFVEDIVAFAICFVIFAVGFLLMLRVGRRRKRLYQKFKQLSPAEQAEINAELSVKFPQSLWGANRLYLRQGLFLTFIDYDDIAWVYPYTAANLPLAFSVMAGGMPALSQDATGLMIWEGDGTRHKIPMGTDAELVYEAMEFLAARVPNIIIGESKERLQLAKTDFERFLLEEGFIDSQKYK